MIHQWKGLHEYYTMENRKFDFFPNKFEIRILTFDEELKSPLLRQYQSYISNWYINGKVFTSTTPWKTENLIFFQKSSKFEFWLLTKSWNHLSFVNISPTLVIDTSMERSSRVLHHGNTKIWYFFFKKVRNSNLTYKPYIFCYISNYKPYIFCFLIRKFVLSPSTFFDFFSNFLSNESEIRNKRYKACFGTDKLPSAKNRNVLPSKLRPVEFFQKFPKFSEKKTKNYAFYKKSHE